MSKLLKSWKILSFGVMTAALGLMMASCVETGNGTGVEDEDTTQTATKYNVSIGTWELDITTSEVDTLTGVTGTRGSGRYEKGETVSITAGTKSGYIFVGWTSDEVSNVFGVDEDGDPVVNPSPTTTFVMPEKNVRISAWYVEAEVPTTDAQAYVRFNWEMEQLPNLHIISASYNDVDAWYSDVYDRQYAELEDSDAFLHISHRPFYDGSRQIPDGIYANFTMGTDYDTQYKSVYFPIDEGDYTAVCTIIDRTFDEPDTFDIVANYEIAVADDADTYIGIGFDVGLFIEGDPLGDDPDTWILKEVFDNDETPSYLLKTPAKSAKFLKKITKGKVTYYVFKRAKK
ncbi:MAG: hypothetical protein LBC59_06060 [Chitinispirillales bacterium]|jgi:uncharacterized repeat protein (TIGR02543 family)|nr:hypothetical protein [Chitinispirillales bacterium]